MASRINTEGPRTGFVGSRSGSFRGHQGQWTALLSETLKGMNAGVVGGRGFLFSLFSSFFRELDACDQIDGRKHGRTGKGVEGAYFSPGDAG